MSKVYNKDTQKEKFILFVTSVEKFKIQGANLTSIKGSRVSGSFANSPIYCKTTINHEHITIKGQSYRPGRAGIYGKILSHIIREGIWTTNEFVKESVTNDFLVPEDSALRVFKFLIVLKDYLIIKDENKVNIVGYAVPVLITELNFFGVLKLESETAGELFLLSSEEPNVEGQILDLCLVSKNIQKEAAFRIIVLSKKNE